MRRGVAALTLGAVFYQLSLLIVTLLIWNMFDVVEQGKFAVFISAIQLIGTLGNLQLHLEVMKNASFDEARNEFAAVRIVSIAVCAALVWLFHISSFGSDFSFLTLLSGSVAISWSEINRSQAIKEENTLGAAMPHFALSLALFAALAFLFTASSVDAFFSAFAFLSFATSFVLGGKIFLGDTRFFLSIFRKGWRFAAYRSPTILVDILFFRGISILITPLGSQFVADFFLGMRLLLAGPQMIIWAVSAQIYRRFISLSLDDLSHSLVTIWRFALFANLALIVVLFVFVVMPPISLNEILHQFGIVVDPRIAVLASLLLISQIFVGWLGRVFDAFNQQRYLFVFEVISKSLALVLIFFAIRTLNEDVFLLTYGCVYLLVATGVILCLRCALSISVIWLLLPYFLVLALWGLVTSLLFFY